MKPLAIDVSTATFQQDVLETSKTVPVVVDFWAPWCGPCRALAPILERLAAEYAGKFRLAKVNTDENPDVAAHYSVRGIPNVKAFVNGTVVDEFTGALPEPAVRRFLESVVPGPGETLRRAARSDFARGDLDGAETKLRQAIAMDAHNHVAQVDLAELMLARGDDAAAEAALNAVPAREQDERAAKLAAKISFARRAKQLPNSAHLKARVDANPDDVGARLAYAERLVADGRYRPALDELLQVVQRDRGEKREQARKAVVDVFGLAAGDPDLVSEYRRRLSAALY